MKSYGIYSVLVALMASSCSREVSPRSVDSNKNNRELSVDGFALADDVSGYSLHAESEYASGVPQTGTKDEFEEADRGKVLILQYRSSASPVTGGVAALEIDSSGGTPIPSHCVGQAACPEAGIYNPNPIRGSVAIRIPASGDLPAFKIRGRSNQPSSMAAIKRAVKAASGGSSSGGESGGSSGGSSGGESEGSSGGGGGGGSSGGGTTGSTLAGYTNTVSPGGACQTRAQILGWLASGSSSLPSSGGSDLNNSFCVHTVTDGSAMLDFEGFVKQHNPTAQGPFMGPPLQTPVTNLTKIAIANVRSDLLNPISTEGIGATQSEASAACAALTLDGASAGEWRLAALSSATANAHFGNLSSLPSPLDTNNNISLLPINSYFQMFGFMDDPTAPMGPTNQYRPMSFWHGTSGQLLDSNGNPAQINLSTFRGLSISSSVRSGVMCVKAPLVQPTFVAQAGPHTCNTPKQVSDFLYGDVTAPAAGLKINGVLDSDINNRFCLHTVGVDNTQFDVSNANGSTNLILFNTSQGSPDSGLKLAIADVSGSIGADLQDSKDACAALSLDGAWKGQWRLSRMYSSGDSYSYLAAPGETVSEGRGLGRIQSYLVWLPGYSGTWSESVYGDGSQWYDAGLNGNGTTSDISIKRSVVCVYDSSLPGIVFNTGLTLTGASVSYVAAAFPAPEMVQFTLSGNTQPVVANKPSNAAVEYQLDISWDQGQTWSQYGGWSPLASNSIIETMRPSPIFPGTGDVKMRINLRFGEDTTSPVEVTVTRAASTVPVISWLSAFEYDASYMGVNLNYQTNDTNNISIIIEDLQGSDWVISMSATEILQSYPGNLQLKTYRPPVGTNNTIQRRVKVVNAAGASEAYQFSVVGSSW